MYRSCLTEIDLRMYRNRSCTECVLMYRNGPLSKIYVPKLYVPKVSCTDVDLPRSNRAGTHMSHWCWQEGRPARIGPEHQ